MIQRSFFILGIAAAFITWPNGVALAHGEPIIVVEPTIAAAGGEITVTGSEMEPGEVFVITLEGSTGTIVLGEATVTVESEEGGFVTTFFIPVDVLPGSYIVTATAEDEDATTADLEITAPVEAASSAPVEMTEPSGEEHTLDRAKPAGQITGVVLVIAITALAGFLLVRRK